MDRWYISDWHLSHWNIIKYCNRPFSSVEEMNEALIENHNKLVKPQDHYSFLGDITIKRGGKLDKLWLIKTIRRFNGHGRLYLGNHDHFPIQTYLEAGFEKIYATWRSEERIICSHFPLHPRSLGHVIANVHGHLHANPSPEPVVYIDKKTQKVTYVPYINVCVEQTDYKPINLDELMMRIRKARGEYSGESVGIPDKIEGSESRYVLNAGRTKGVPDSEDA